MKKIVTKLVSVALIAGLAGCAAPGQPGGINNTTGGTVIGAVLGGLAGSQIGGGSGQLVGAVAGTMLGGFLGNRIGASMDQAAQIQADAAAQDALNSGAPADWNSRSAHGTVAPIGHAYRNRYRERCRRYKTVVWIGAQQRIANGVACLRGDQWQIVSQR